MNALAHAVPRGTIAAGRRLAGWLPAVVVFGLGIAGWQWLPGPLGIDLYLLPRFTTVVTEFWNDRSALWGAGWFTFKEALGGFAIGCGAGFATAVVVARWRRLGGALLPYAVAANAVPIIAFAPITNAWFGALNPTSKMAIAAILCYFPVFVNTTRGLTSAQPAALELMRSYAAGEVAIFRRVRLPTALPYVFSALKVGTVLAMIGAVVGDYFGGTQEALGIQVRASVGIFQLDRAWALILVASIIGIGFYSAVGLVERSALSWHASTRSGHE